MKKYIYAHAVDREVLYVGMGNARRPYRFSHRTYDWALAMMGRTPEVAIIAVVQAGAVAREVERTWIETLRPVGNRHGNPDAAKCREMLLRRLEREEKKAKRNGGK